MRMNLKFTSRQRELSKIKYTIAQLLLLMLLFQSCTKDPADFGVTTSFETTSANTETAYKIDVFYPDASFPTTPVPIVVMLDGFWYHDMGAELLAELSEEGTIPKCLMVSIDYVSGTGVYDRADDLIYPVLHEEDSRVGPAFYGFLTEELVPNIEANYMIDTTQRVLIGHSLGGFFALYSLFDNPTEPFFQKRIAASGSIGLGDNELFVLEEAISTQVSDIDQDLFIGCGTLVGSATIMHQELFNRIDSRNYPNMNIAFETYPKTHGTDPYPSFKNGLRHVFN
ncbi:MAG: hypothetical protein K9G41_09155 [Flavobacteriales bacterium]|nr:hypothetical protein [Flavobacteriales bacterium]